MYAEVTTNCSSVSYKLIHAYRTFLARVHSTLPATRTSAVRKYLLSATTVIAVVFNDCLYNNYCDTAKRATYKLSATLNRSVMASGTQHQA